MKELSIIIRQEIKDPRIHMMTSEDLQSIYQCAGF